ncbi:tRNA 2-thiouridine(34) synthase MnmA [Buchnera aphidicola (Kurisakia onigurumii)]|uniref:tRNA 2-thiouridine(34) synthase MnmA n=1 Tax=Buchnera aphidicola TaxID=9 RepID=UPI0031B7218B
MVNKKIIVAMSGGVDSSVSALILKKKKYQVEGLFMKNWEEDDTTSFCHSKKDLKDVTSVCNSINIPLHIVNFSIEYWDLVFKKFLKDLKQGKTPNPDILCNKEIKFKLFLKFAIENLNADFIATGHYVQKKKYKNNFFLCRSKDTKKDQSYFLYTLNQYQISKTIFPIGNLQKLQVRKIAKNNHISVFDKKDSTGICFIEPKKFSLFIRKFINSNPGDIVSVSGKILGKHIGLENYTLGQRKGLNIGGMKYLKNSPWYVVDKNIHTNELIVEQDNNNIYLLSIGMLLQSVNWINEKTSLKKYFYCTVKTRYLQKDIPCIVFHKKLLYTKVLFIGLVSSITPGQSAVFYSKKICLGGGIIEKKLPFV